MLQHRVIPSTRPWRSIRFASQLSQSPTDGRPAATASGNAETARRPSSILSRLSDRTQSRVRGDSDTEQKSLRAPTEIATAGYRTPRPRATSFISALSAQKRDNAAEKWFTDVRELDISNVNQLGDPKSLPRKQRRSDSPRKHEMRPRTDLNALFAPTTARSATSQRIQAKKELGGDYAGYLPDGHADPYRLPVAYARLVLGRNKHIPLNAQTGALNIIEEAIRRKVTG